MNEDAGGPGGFAAVGGEDGVVVLAGDARAARRALEGEQPGGPTRELLNEIDAPVRDATSLAGGGDTCVRGIALGDSIDPPELEMVVKVSGEASADRVEDPASDAGDAFSAGEPEAEGDLGRAPADLSPTTGHDAHPGAGRSSGRAYRCPGA